MSRFIDTLLAARTPVIAEVKPRSSGGADLIGGRPVADIVQAYHEAGAACLSVVTGRWFGGDLALLREVTALTGLPLLQKDFITRHSQLAAASELGVSAVLITAGVLPASVVSGLTDRALALGLTPFVEVTTEQEIESVRHPQECVIAVNNKDIKTRERGVGDLTRSMRLLPAVLASGTRCPVSASGIDLPSSAARLLSAGYAGLLVGTGLLSTASPQVWCAELDRLRAADHLLDNHLEKA